jgi:hypothetical protein
MTAVAKSELDPPTDPAISDIDCDRLTREPTAGELIRARIPAHTYMSCFLMPTSCP